MNDILVRVTYLSGAGETRELGDFPFREVPRKGDFVCVERHRLLEVDCVVWSIGNPHLICKDGGPLPPFYDLDLDVPPLNGGK